jgi:hypothetical protein
VPGVDAGSSEASQRRQESRLFNEEKWKLHRPPLAGSMPPVRNYQAVLSLYNLGSIIPPETVLDVIVEEFRPTKCIVDFPFIYQTVETGSLVNF